MSSKSNWLGLAILIAYLYPITADELPQAEVMLFGVFHFASPGLDKVKTKHVDVTTPESQRYLEELTARIAEFGPTVILVEEDPKHEAELQQEYRDYLAGNYDLGVNEIYQLGFRIAEKAGLETVYTFDERSVQWNAQPLFDYMPENDPAAQQAIDALIAEITEDMQQAHDTLSLPQLLARMNDADFDQLNKSLYLVTNQVGAGDNFVGADAAASWWHRNFRMYANVQKHAVPGARVLVIGGQGHIAILKDLLADDMDRKSVDVVPYL